MINKEQLQDLYSQGTVAFNANQLADVPVANAAKFFLTENGLPVSTGKEDVLGIHFISSPQQMTPVTVSGNTYWKIGYEWEEERTIGIREGGNEVYEIDPGNGGKATFINTDLASFLLLLQYYKQYDQRKSAADTTTVTTMGRDELLKRLEQMKNRTAAAPPPKKEKFDQRKEFRAMKEFIQKTDSQSIGDENYWWSMVLEQVEDDLL